MKDYIVFFSTAIGLSTAASFGVDGSSLALLSRHTQSGQGNANLQRRDIDDLAPRLQRRGRKQKDKKAAKQQAKGQPSTPAQEPNAGGLLSSIWSVPPETFPTLPATKPRSDASPASVWSVPPGTFPPIPGSSAPGSSSGLRPSSAVSRSSFGESPRVASSGARNQRSTRPATRERRGRRETPSVTSRLSRLRDIPESGASLASTHSQAASATLPNLEFENLHIDSPAVSSSGSTGRPAAPKPARWEMTSKPSTSPHSPRSGKSGSPPTPPDAGSTTASPMALAGAPKAPSPRIEHSRSSPASSGAPFAIMPSVPLAGPSNSDRNPEFRLDKAYLQANRPQSIAPHQPHFEQNFAKTSAEVARYNKLAAKQGKKAKGKGSRSGAMPVENAGSAEVAEAELRKKKAMSLRTIANYDYNIAKETLTNNKPGLSIADAAFRRVTLSANDAVYAGKDHARAESKAAKALEGGKNYCDAAKHMGNSARAYSRCILRNGLTKSFQDRYTSMIGNNLAKAFPKEDPQQKRSAVEEALYLRKNYENSVQEYRNRIKQDRKVRNEWPGSSSDESEKSFSDVKRQD